MECELTSGCIFFNDKMKNMPAMSELYKRNYCKGDFSQCARFIVCKSLGRDKVPEDLFPNQQDRAKKILED